MSNYTKHILLVLFIVVVLIVLYNNSKYSNNSYNILYNKDTFTYQPNQKKQIMTFNFLNDSNNNTQKVLQKYYLNDDAKSNNIRLVNHPYQIKTITPSPYVNKKIYGNSNQYNYQDKPQQSRIVYQSTGIRL